MSSIIVIEAETGKEVRRIDTTNLSERGRERAFMGVCRQADLDKYIISEED